MSFRFALLPCRVFVGTVRRHHHFYFLQAMDANIDIIQYLTPAHFFNGDHLFAVPREPLDLHKTLKSRWLMIQQRIQALWNLWYSAYLYQLQQRFKWKKTKEWYDEIEMHALWE